MKENTHAAAIAVIQARKNKVDFSLLSDIVLKD